MPRVGVFDRVVGTSRDAGGDTVQPGPRKQSSQLSLFEISGLEQTRDHAELARFQPDLSAGSAVNPFSAHIEVARAEESDE